MNKKQLQEDLARLTLNHEITDFTIASPRFKAMYKLNESGTPTLRKLEAVTYKLGKRKLYPVSVDLDDDDTNRAFIEADEQAVKFHREYNKRIVSKRTPEQIERVKLINKRAQKRYQEKLRQERAERASILQERDRRD